MASSYPASVSDRAATTLRPVRTEARLSASDHVPRCDWLPFFTPRRVGQNWVLTNRMGEWQIVRDEEYRALQQLFVPRELIERLAKHRLVIHGENEQTLLARWRGWNGPHYDGPSLHIVHLTQRCNLTCNYCSSSAIPVTARGRDLDSDVAVRVADFIAESPAEHITVIFFGGEPTLRPDLMELMLARLTRSCSLSGKILHAGMTTNGTLLSGEVLEVLERYQVKTSISFDGPPDIHDRIRTYENGAGSYDDAVDGRRTLQASSPELLGGPALVLTRESIHRVREIIGQFVDMGQTVIALKPVAREGFGKASWGDHAIEFDEYWAAYEDGLDYMKELMDKKVFVIEAALLTALRKVFEGQNLGNVDRRNPCGLVYGVLSYDVDGKIHACHGGLRQKEFLLGTVDDPWDDIVMSRKAAEIASSSVLEQHAECRACAYLPYCAPCPAHNFQNTGNREMVPHQSWECLFTLKLHDYVFGNLDRNPETLLAWWRRYVMRTLRCSAQHSTTQSVDSNATFTRS